MEEKDYKIIDQFLQGELPEEKHTEFNQRLENDEAFAAAFELRQQMTNYLKANQKQPALEAKMAELGQQYFKDETQASAKIIRMPFLRIGIGIAAAIALLLLVWNPFNSDDLYSQFASHPPLALVEKGVAKEIVQQAEQAYNQQDYEAAFKALSILVENDPAYLQAQFAFGISALETNRIEIAQTTFESLANGSSLLKNYGQWYLALSYIKQGKGDKAKPILEAINDDEPVLKKNAAALLEQL